MVILNLLFPCLILLSYRALAFLYSIPAITLCLPTTKKSKKIATMAITDKMPNIGETMPPNSILNLSEILRRKAVTMIITRPAMATK
jgi:hypothetical protein